MTLADRQKETVFFPWTAQEGAKQFAIKEASGCYFVTDSGQRVLDFSSFIYNANLGHGHPKMREAMVHAAQNAHANHPAMIHEEKAKLGENLRRITSLSKSFLCLSGAEANENAVKIARMFTGKHKVVTRYRSYHGATLGAIGFSGDYRRIPFDDLGTGTIRIPDPYPRGSGQTIDTVRLLEEIIEIEGSETIACVLLEGITGTNGVFVPPADYWPRIREICTRNQILLIDDEVMSGFGRTGKWFGINHFNVTPDMMTLAKGITAGFAPLGAVVVNEAISRYFDRETLWCGLTNYGNPFACAVANAAIDIYEQEGLLENAQVRGKQLQTLLVELKQSHPLVAETRSIGLLAAIDLQKSPDNPAPYIGYRAKGEDAQKAKYLQQAFLAAGINVLVRFGTIIIAPPLCITEKELSEGMALVKKVLAEHLA